MKGINNAYIILLSKIKGDNKFAEFKPINLMNGIYKIMFLRIIGFI